MMFPIDIWFRISYYGIINKGKTMTYSDDLISDLHKDVYGYRPREAFWSDWDNCTPVEKQKTWDEYCRSLDVQEAETKLREEKDVDSFKQNVEAYITFGARDYLDALRWMTKHRDFANSQCVEHWVWNQGILFTQYGKQVLKDLLTIVKYKDC